MAKTKADTRADGENPESPEHAGVGVTTPDVFDKEEEKVRESIRAALENGYDDEVNTELGRLLVLVADVFRARDASLVFMAKMALISLLEKRNVGVARRIITDLRKRIRARRWSVLAVMRSDSPASHVVLGLVALAVICMPVLLIGASTLYEASVPQIWEVVLVGTAGALGGIVSIMVRLQDIAATSEHDPFFLFMTGFFRPIIGVVFALFIFCILKAEIFNIFQPADGTPEIYFYIAAAFVAGFSERFAQDVAKRTEQTVGSG